MNSHITPGMKFGKWTVLSFVAVKDSHKKWLCRCECGVQRKVLQSNLCNGHSTGCRQCGHSKPARNIPYARTWREVAAIVGVSPQAAQQIGERALRKVGLRLRAELEYESA